MVYVCTAFIGLPVVVGPCPNDDVGVSIPVHVSSCSNRFAEISAGLVALCGPVGGGTKTRCRSVVYVRTTLVGWIVAVQVCPDDDVGVPVSVHISRRPNRVAKEGSDLIALCGPVGSGAKPRCRAMVYVRTTLIGLLVVVQICPDDDVGVPIPVHVSSGPHRVTEPGVFLIALRGPVGGSAQP